MGVPIHHLLGVLIVLAVHCTSCPTSAQAGTAQQQTVNKRKENPAKPAAVRTHAHASSRAYFAGHKACDMLLMRAGRLKTSRAPRKTSSQRDTPEMGLQGWVNKDKNA